MGKTLLELFKGSTQDKSVKSDKETLVEQELTGVRIKSAVEINNPLIYGNEATRIAQRSTPDLEKMKGSTGGEAGDGGLIGKGLSKLGVEGGIGGLRDKVNDKLGIPKLLIPTEVVNKIEDGKSNKKGDTHYRDSQTPITQDFYGKNGSDVGKFLKQTGGGNPKTIVKQAGGKLIGKAKDKLRGALFGSPDTLGAGGSNTGLVDKDGEPMVRFTTNEQGLTYSEQKQPLKINKGDELLKELKKTKLDLSLVSPIYGVRRNSSTSGAEEGRFGKTNNAFQAGGGYAVQEYAPNKPENTYMEGNVDTPIYAKFGLGSGDSINLLSPSDKYTLDDNNAFAIFDDKTLYDFIPVWMKKIGSKKPIMFRALISGLTESVTPSWSTSKFVGNPYNFYTFDSIERSTSFNLKMYCNNAVELATNWEKITKITQMTYPTIGAQFATAPIMRFRIGDIYNNKTGFIDSLTYTIPDDSNWETNGESGWLPKIIDVAISIKFIESVGAEDRPYDYTISKAAAKAINDKRGATAEIGASQTESDGAPSADKPEKAETKGGKLSDAKENAKSTLNKLGDKVSDTAGAIKSAIATPADQESATLPDNASQGGVSDKFDGKSATEAIKEASNTASLNNEQAKSFVYLKAEYPKLDKISRSELSARGKNRAAFSEAPRPEGFGKNLTFAAFYTAENSEAIKEVVLKADGWYSVLTTLKRK